MRHKGNAKVNRIILCTSAIVLLGVAVFYGMPHQRAQASGKTLTVGTAREMALMSSTEYAGLQNKMALTKVKYTQSIKSIKLKEKNQRTFRWSPLLNFKFPEKADLADEFEYTYKPLELQSEITVLQHSLEDCVFGVYEKVETCFLKTYVLQENIAFREKQIAECEASLNKNKARLLLGMANQADIDSLEKRVAALQETLAADQRSFEAEKEKLGGLIGIDVRTSYTFECPFVTASLDRTLEEELIQYTLDHDDAFYQAKRATANGQLQLDTNYRLMEKQYGSKLRSIDSFINQAKQGEKLDATAFKSKYGELLEDVDEPWQGKIRILFIKIPREWFKGAIDGVRYVEDEPYALYESAVEYQGLVADQKAMEKELIATVKSSYENYVSARNASETLERDIRVKSEELQKSQYLNRTGKMTYEEYMQVVEEYEDLQMDYTEAMSDYSQILYSFNRLTCGALSPHLKGDAVQLALAGGGQSYVIENQGDGVYYYIHSMVENNVFELGLSIPQDSEWNITDFELWVDGTQIGERTPVSKTIRHLTFDMDSIERVFIRLYEGEQFLDDCDIDPDIMSDKLLIRSYQVVTVENDVVGSYQLQTSATGLLQLKIKPSADQQMAYYNIKTQEGIFLAGDDKLDINEKFSYLLAAESSLEELTICFYDANQQLLYEAGFYSGDQSIRKK